MKCIGVTLALIFFALLSCGPAKKEYIHDGFTPEKPTIDVNKSDENTKKYADVLRSDDPNYMKELRDPILTAVTREFGYTIISKNREFPFQSDVGKADLKPWSSWWYPKRDSSLFDDSRATNASDYDHLSTLSKFYLVKKSLNPSAQSAAEYEKNIFDQNAQSWEGLCDAWAIASISVPEPKRSVSITIDPNSHTKVTFDVTDLKGLLLKTFEAVDDNQFKYYGQKFTGQESGWIYPDIFPEQFHRFLEVQLFQKHQTFIIDTDQGVEVWSAPVFKANYVMSALPNDPDAVFVRTWIYIADSIKNKMEKSFIGTKEVIREYNYVLKGHRNTEGNLVVNVGYWVKGSSGVDSRKDHPDFIMVPPPPESLVRKSWNPEIDKETVDKILSQSY